MSFLHTACARLRLLYSQKTRISYNVLIYCCPVIINYVFAALFLVYVVYYYLRDGGRVAWLHGSRPSGWRD